MAAGGNNRASIFGGMVAAAVVAVVGAWATNHFLRSKCSEGDVKTCGSGPAQQRCREDGSYGPCMPVQQPSTVVATNSQPAAPRSPAAPRLPAPPVVPNPAEFRAINETAVAGSSQLGCKTYLEQISGAKWLLVDCGATRTKSVRVIAGKPTAHRLFDGGLVVQQTAAGGFEANFHFSDGAQHRLIVKPRGTGIAGAFRQLPPSRRP